MISEETVPQKLRTNRALSRLLALPPGAIAWQEMRIKVSFPFFHDSRHGTGFESNGRQCLVSPAQRPKQKILWAIFRVFAPNRDLAFPFRIHHFSIFCVGWSVLCLPDPICTKTGSASKGTSDLGPCPVKFRSREHARLLPEVGDTWRGGFAIGPSFVLFATCALALRRVSPLSFGFVA